LQRYIISPVFRRKTQLFSGFPALHAKACQPVEEQETGTIPYKKKSKAA